MTIRSQVIEIEPTLFMRNYIDSACDYRRYCWNKGLALWQNLYQIRLLMLPPGIRNTLRYNIHHSKNPRFLSNYEMMISDLYPAPNWKRIRDLLVEDKEDWELNYSARILQEAMRDLGKAWQNFFDKAQPDWGMPKFKSKRSNKQSFRTDRAKIVNDRLLLERPRTISKHLWSNIKLMEKPKSNRIKTANIKKVGQKYYVSITYDFDPAALADNNSIIGIDLNVKHFDLPKQTIDILPKRLNKYYRKVKYYQRRLAKKRNYNPKNVDSNNYLAMRAKLQKCYQKISNIQTDLMQKLTTQIIKQYGTIVIEDLNVKGMQMTHIVSKGLHRAMFGKFRSILQYKCQWYKRNLIIAHKLYPSTQRCSNCGWVKRGIHKLGLAGNSQDHEDHDTYICQHCGLVINRDYNACLNLQDYARLLIEEPEYLKRICTTQTMR